MTKVFECIFLITADEIPVAQRILMHIAAAEKLRAWSYPKTVFNAILFGKSATVFTNTCTLTDFPQYIAVRVRGQGKAWKLTKYY